MKTKITLESDQRSRRKAYDAPASAHWHGCAKEWICGGRLLAREARFTDDNGVAARDS